MLECENVTMSGLSGGSWSKLCSQVGVDGNDISVNLNVPNNRYVSINNEFKWDEKNENQQSNEYITYIKSLLTLPSQTCLLDIHGSKQLLTIYTSRINLTGTTDAIIVLKDNNETESTMNDLPSRLLASRSLVIIELKKEKIEEKHRTQAKAELLAADLTGMLCRPICLLSNLDNYYELFWLSQLKFYSCKLEAGAALAVINAVLQELTEEKNTRLGNLDIFNRDKIRSIIKMLPGIKEEQSPPKRQKTENNNDNDNNDDDGAGNVGSNISSSSIPFSFTTNNNNNNTFDDTDVNDSIRIVRRLPGEEGGLEQYMSAEESDYYFNRFARQLFRNTFPSLLPNHIQATINYRNNNINNHNTSSSSIPFSSTPAYGMYA
jgi:hypothetical protein